MELTKEVIRSDKQLLRSFVNNLYWAGDLTDLEAKRNLESGIVEIVNEDGGHQSNGLLITENGYFVTSAHCVYGKNSRRFIRYTNGCVFPIQKICAMNKPSDIAIAKFAVIGRETQMKYRFRNDVGDRTRLYPVNVVTRWNMQLKVKGGYVNRPRIIECEYSTGKLNTNGVNINAEVTPGDSGGTVIDSDYQIYGILRSRSASDSYEGRFTFWSEALRLISKISY